MGPDLPPSEPLKAACSSTGFSSGMRFTSAQLRLLQDSLAPPMPPLEAPPELSAPRAPAPRPPPAQCQGSQAPLSLLLGGYLLGAAVLALSAVSSADMSSAGLTLGSAVLSPALLLHSLALQRSRCAQAAGAACSLLLFPVLTLTPSGRPEPVAALAVACAAFFALSADGQGQVALFVRGFGALAAAVACGACAPELPRHVRAQLWGFAAAFVGLQAVVTSSQLFTFRLFCAVL